MIKDTIIWTSLGIYHASDVKDLSDHKYRVALTIMVREFKKIIYFLDERLKSWEIIFTIIIVMDGTTNIILSITTPIIPIIYRCNQFLKCYFLRM